MAPTHRVCIPILGSYLIVPNNNNNWCRISREIYVHVHVHISANYAHTIKQLNLFAFIVLVYIYMYLLK